jgi:hypothetical protein
MAIQGLGALMQAIRYLKRFITFEYRYRNSQEQPD